MDGIQAPTAKGMLELQAPTAKGMSELQANTQRMIVTCSTMPGFPPLSSAVGRRSCMRGFSHVVVWVR